MMEIKTRKQLDARAWKELIARSSQGSFYHNLEWIDACCQGMRGYQAFFIVLPDSLGNYQAGLPWVRCKRYGLSKHFSMPFGTYGGILAVPGTDTERLDALASFALIKIWGPLSVEQNIVCYNGMTDWRTHGFQPAKLTTHVVAMEEYANNPAHLHKRGAVQARAQGLEIRDLSGGGAIADCYRLIEARDRRIGQLTRYPASLYHSIYKNIGPAGNLWWRMAFKDGQLLGFALSFIHKEEAYYWEGVTLREGEGLRPADALFTDLFTMALGRGLKRVNLGGSPQGAEGLVRYKEAWGASPVEYLSYVRITPWFNRLRELGRR